MCSKGKREYIQLLWLMLDPRGELLPESGAPRPRGRAAACRRAWGQGVHGGRGLRGAGGPRSKRVPEPGAPGLRSRAARCAAAGLDWGRGAGWRVRRRARLAGGGPRPAQPPHSLPPFSPLCRRLGRAPDLHLPRHAGPGGQQERADSAGLLRRDQAARAHPGRAAHDVPGRLSGCAACGLGLPGGWRGGRGQTERWGPAGGSWVAGSPVDARAPPLPCPGLIQPHRLPACIPRTSRRGVRARVRALHHVLRRVPAQRPAGGGRR